MCIYAVNIYFRMKWYTINLSFCDGFIHSINGRYSDRPHDVIDSVLKMPIEDTNTFLNLLSSYFFLEIATP